MTFENIILERKGGVGTIRLNRPKNFNAIDFGLGNDLARALEICHDDDDTRVVVLTGEGKAFCSGGDLKLFRENMKPYPQDIVRQLIKVFNIIIMGLRQMPKPVVAVINGPLGGGGFSLAAACDIRIAARSAIFRQAYTSISLVPDGAWTLVVPMLIGFGKATELVLLDPVLTAQQAQDWGLVNRVVDDADLWKEANEIIGKLAARPDAGLCHREGKPQQRHAGAFVPAARTGAIRYDPGGPIRRLPRGAHGILRKTHGRFQRQVKKCKEVAEVSERSEQGE